jgi:hypothetical protein
MLREICFSTLNDSNLPIAQPIQLIHQPVNHFVCRVDLALKRGFLVVSLGGRQLLVKIDRGLDEFRDSVEALHIGGLKSAYTGDWEE